MEKDPYKQIHKAERERRNSAKAERFWSAFRLTENGKVKSTLLLNSFCLSFLFALVYAAAFYLMIDPLHSILGGLPPFLENLAESVLPAMLGTAVCSISWLIFKEKRMMLASYIWLLVIALAALITMIILLWGESAQIVAFLHVFLMLVLAPLLLGSAVAVYLYSRYWKRKHQH